MSEDHVHVIVEDDPPRRPRLPVWIPIVGIVGVIVWVWGTTSRDSTTPTPTTATSIATSVTLGATTTTLLAPVPSTTKPRPSTAVFSHLLDGAEVLEGDVAVATRPGSTGGGVLWVLGAEGGPVRVDGVPFWPGDYPYPMLMTAGNVVFANLTDGYVVDATEPSTLGPLAEASFVIPGASAGHVWFIGDGVEWVAPVDVEARTVGERFDVAGDFWWPVAGFGDGLIVIPVDEEAYGRQAYWTPAEGLQPLDLSNSSQAGIHAVSGNLAVVVLPGVARVQDLATGEILNTFDLDLGEGLVSSVCISPDQQNVAIVGSTGEGFVGDIGDGSVAKLPLGIQDRNGIGWTSSSQLVYVIDVDDETPLQTLDITTGETRDIAALRSVTDWMVAADAAMC